MFGKLGIYITILVLVFLFYLVIALGAGVFSKINKLSKDDIIKEQKNIDALSLYWTFLLIVWIVFFLIMYVFNDTVIAWCKALLS